MHVFVACVCGCKCVREKEGGVHAHVLVCGCEYDECMLLQGLCKYTEHSGGGGGGSINNLLLLSLR